MVIHHTSSSKMELLESHPSKVLTNVASSSVFQMSEPPLSLSWGVAGVGMIAHDFLTALATLPPTQHRVAAIAGKDLERVHRLATLHKIGTAYEGYDALARDTSIGTYSWRRYFRRYP